MWILGFKDIFQRVNKSLTNEKIFTELQINLKEIDPETEIFHPAQAVAEIMALVGNTYNKKKGEVNQLMGQVEKEDLHILMKSEKCDSFTKYCGSLELDSTS